MPPEHVTVHLIHDTIHPPPQPLKLEILDNYLQLPNTFILNGKNLQISPSPPKMTI
jgi:hypothetical protein